jgi:hypothetical protein
MRKIEAKTDPQTLTPASDELAQHQAEMVQAIEEMKAYRRSAPPITIEEVLAARDEGRKYGRHSP